MQAQICLRYMGVGIEFGLACRCLLSESESHERDRRGLWLARRLANDPENVGFGPLVDHHQTRAAITRLVGTRDHRLAV